MKLGPFKLFNNPIASLVCDALASSYNNISQVICEFIDNAVSNLLAHGEDASLVRMIRIMIRNLGDTVDITIEDGGTGMEDVHDAMTLCSALAGDTPLNMSGCGFKASFSYIESNHGTWECFTRTIQDRTLDRHCYFKAPYDFGDGVFTGEYRAGWVNTLNNTGTVIHFTCPMHVFATLNPSALEEKPTFPHLVSILRENIRYTYSQILMNKSVTMEFVVHDGTNENRETLEGLAPIWKSEPTALTPQTIDLGDGPVTIYCQYGTILGDPNNLFHYKANMESSGAEISINGRVIEHGLMREIWRRRIHPSQNGFLTQINLVAPYVTAIPKTKAAKNGFREADPKLKELFLWIRKCVPLPEVVKDSKEKRLLRKFEEKLKKLPGYIRSETEMNVFRSIHLSVLADLFEVRDNRIRIYEGKARKTAALDLYQLRMYWDACVKDGYPPDEAILIGKSHSEDVLHLANYLNTLQGADGRPYNFSLTTWKEQDISL